LVAIQRNLVGVAYRRFLPLSSRHSRVAGVQVFNLTVYGSSAHEDDEVVIGSPAREDDEVVIGSPLREDDGQVRLKR
jgi:hypothetical protein